jgi:hypothetical protein
MKLPVPREHGAWGLLLQPFVAGAVLAGNWSWPLLPALGLVLLGFLLREPLIVIARRRLVWRRAGAEEKPAWLWAALEALGLAACFALLARAAPLPALLALAGVAAGMTVAAVWVTVRNRQRSIVFQVVSAAGLSTTALLAVLASTAAIPGWAWWLWAVLSAQAAASILVVHARLRIRAARGAAAGGGILGAAYTAQALQLAAGAAHPPLALAFVFSALANAAELLRLRSARNLGEALTRVGFRTLAVSLVHMAISIYCLWPQAKG